MKKKINIYVLQICLLIVLTVVCIMVGCKEEKVYEVFDDNTLTIASGKTTKFKIIYSEKEYYGSEDLKTGINGFIEAVTEKTGAVIEKEPLEPFFYEEETYQIIIGNTGFPESDKVLSQLDFNDYAIQRDGNKIVVIGGGLGATVKALEDFSTAILEKEQVVKKYIDFTNDMSFIKTIDNEIQNITICGNDIKDYVFVLPSEETTIEDELAVMMQQEIANKQGTLLPVSSKISDGKKNIYVGNASSYAQELSVTQYTLRVNNGEVHIAAGSASAYDYAFEKFCQLFTGSSNVEITEDFEITEDLAEVFKADGNALGEKTGDVRLMFHNVYGYDRTPTIKHVRRFRLQSNVYSDYNPDMLMFQEFSAAAGTVAPSNISALGYKQIGIPTEGFRLHTPLYYKPDVLKVIEAGTFLYTFEYDKDSRVKNDTTKGVTWAVMEVIETGKRFVVMNTHMYWNVDKTDADGNSYESDDLRYMAGANIARISNATELLNILDGILAVPEYADLPVILGGDLNCRYSDVNVKSVQELYDGRIALHVIEEYGFKSAQLTAPIADTSASLCGYPKYDNYYGYYYYYGNPKKNKQKSVIDHIFYFGDSIEPLLFDIVDTTFIRKTSDHMPVYLDFNLK